MSLRLRLASWWVPRPILARELDRVAQVTTAALDALLEAHVPQATGEISSQSLLKGGSLEEWRAAMATAHASRVAALVGALGREEAVRLGRQALFQVGWCLGQEVRGRLGVSDRLVDLLQAARVLYRILGIHFQVQWLGEGRALLTVHRCALAQYYSEAACLILSAADEGVVRGLNPQAAMAFEARMTGGTPVCSAGLALEG